MCSAAYHVLAPVPVVDGESLNVVLHDWYLEELEVQFHGFIEEM